MQLWTKVHDGHGHRHDDRHDGFDDAYRCDDSDDSDYDEEEEDGDGLPLCSLVKDEFPSLVRLRETHATLSSTNFSPSLPTVECHRNRRIHGFPLWSTHMSLVAGGGGDASTSMVMSFAIGVRL